MVELNEKIWIKYAQGIQSWSGKDGKPDPNAIYFIASAVNKGPAAGSFVPIENMNNVLFEQCDALIADTSPVYNPGNAGSYFDCVDKYISAVKIKGNEDQGLKQQLKDVKEELKNVKKEFREMQKEETKNWEEDPHSGAKAKVAFGTWVSSNAPDLLQLQNEVQILAGKQAQIQLQIGGEGAAKLSNQQNTLIQAGTRATYVPGVTMQSTLDQISPADYEKYYKATQDGTVGKLPPLQVTGAFNRPAYSIEPTFETTMDQWARVPLDAKDEFEYSIKSEELTETSWTKLGHKNGGVSFGWGFLRIQVGGSKEWKESEIVKKSGSFEIQLSAQRAGLFNVNPGIWNVKRFRQVYPNVDVDTGMAKNAVQPTQLFCASRVKIKVKFTGEMEKEFDKVVEDTKGGKAGFSFLGFKIGAGGGTRDRETTHTSKLQKEDGWYKMEPTLVAGGCSMLAVIGNKLNEQ